MTYMQNRIVAAHPERVDLKIITGFVTTGARVLDVGCGDGALLARLEDEKQADGRGIELSQKGVNEAVARGLSVVQGDADHDLAVRARPRLSPTLRPALGPPAGAVGRSLP